MFERNKVDNAQDSRNAVPVEITLADGDVMVGRIMIPAGRNVFDQLNGPATFLEVEPYGAERTFIAKTAVRSIRIVPVPGANHLNARMREANGFDPATVLGVRADAPFDEVRHAYHAKAKAYHPDRYQSLELPAEVRDYLTAMLGRVNVAFAALEKAEEAKARTAAVRAARGPAKFGEARARV